MFRRTFFHVSCAALASLVIRKPEEVPPEKPSYFYDWSAWQGRGEQASDDPEYQDEPLPNCDDPNVRLHVSVDGIELPIYDVYWIYKLKTGRDGWIEHNPHHYVDGHWVNVYEGWGDSMRLKFVTIRGNVRFWVTEVK